MCEVTIGIPVYRAVDYIANTMRSALAQTYPDIEFLIVDDWGDDGSMSVVEQLQRQHPRGNRIRIVRNAAHSGVGSSRNHILDEARGRYLYFMDSDDTIEPDTIELLVKTMEQHRVSVVYASYEIIDKVKFTPTQTYRKDRLLVEHADDLAEYAFHYNSVFQIMVCNSLIDLDFLRHSGLRFIDTSFWEDMAFTTELVTRVERAVLLPDITYHYLQRPGSLSHYQDRKQLHKSEIERNVATIDYLKSKCAGLRGKKYLPWLCFNLEMNSFYIVCHILKHAERIVPQFSAAELCAVIRHPLGLADVLRFRRKLVANLGFLLLGRLPLPLFVPAVRLLGRLKHSL